MKKPMSDKAQVAAIIRAKIKELGIGGKVRASADNYFGSEVRVQLINPHPCDMDELRRLADKHTKGSYSAESGCYIFDYAKMQAEELPRVLYVSFHLLYTSEYRQRALDAIAKAHKLGGMLVESVPTKICINNSLMSSEIEIEKVLQHSKHRCADMWTAPLNN